MNEKLKYTPIQFGIIQIILEDGLLDGSADFTGGTADNVYSPDVTDWGQDIESGSAKGDF